MIGDHRRAVLVPVGVVCAADRAVDVDQLLNGAVTGCSRDLGQLNGPFKNGIRPAIGAGDIDRRPRVAAQVVHLGPTVDNRDPDQLRRGVEGKADRRELWSAVTLDGHERA